MESVITISNDSNNIKYQRGLCIQNDMLLIQQISYSSVIGYVQGNTK